MMRMSIDSYIWQHNNLIPYLSIVSLVGFIHNLRQLVSVLFKSDEKEWMKIDELTNVQQKYTSVCRIKAKWKRFSSQCRRLCVIKKF